MKNTVRHIALFLTFVFVLSAVVFVNNATPAQAAEVKTYVGDMTISRGSIGWNAGEYENQLMLVKPGSTLNGLYFGKVYAVYNSSVGGYVVTEKAGLHCSYSKTVATGAVGLAISYQPLTTTGSDFARANWFVWQQIRIGDILTFENVDVATGTVNVSGTFGNSDFVSTSKVKVTTVRDSNAAKTAFTGKTIVSLGDSVTAGGAWTEAVEIAINSRVINASTPGARTDEGLGYFEKQVAAHNPDYVFIKYAINDCIQYTITDNTLPNYKQNLRDLCEMSLAIGALPILITTNKVQASDSSRYANYGGLYNYYPQYIQAIRDVAAEYNTFCIDIYSGVWASLTPSSYLIDTVHPNTAGYTLEANFISNYLITNQDAIAAAAAAISGNTDGMPAAATNFALASNGGSYMYPTTTYPGGTAYYSNAYYGDNANQGGSYFNGKLNDGVIPADGIPNNSNTNWAVYFSGASNPSITIKLGGAAYLNNISFIGRNGAASGITYIMPVISSIELSNDGVSFTATTAFSSRTTVYSGVNHKLKLSFNEVLKASYIRINLSTPTDRTAIGEIEVWGDTKAPEGSVPFELVDGSDYKKDDINLTLNAAMISGSAVKAQFQCEVTVLDSKGVAIADGAYVGTGFSVVTYGADGSITNSVVVVVPGDADGDAAITNTDYLALRSKVLANSTNITTCFDKACDYSQDGGITSVDILALASIIAG